MNKIQYGNRTLYEKDGKFLKYFDGQYVGEDNRAKAFSWLYEANPYKLETVKLANGYKGWVRDTTSGKVIAENSFLRNGEEGDNEIWARLCNWSARYIRVNHDSVN